MAEDKKLFAGGGMDMDTEERLIAPNDYRYALNTRIQSPDGDNFGVVENIKGNEILADVSSLQSQSGIPLDDDRFKVIGSYEDKKLNILYYFVCDTSGGNDHCIVSNYQWNSSLGGVPAGFRTLLDSGLNFHKNYLITGVNMIHSDEVAKGGILYWTDDLNPPCKLNVLRAYWWMVNPGGITDFKLSYQESPVLDAIPKAPTEPPLVNSGTWDAKKANYIKGNLWQFKYRYVYHEAEKSAWSPISESITTRNTFSNTVLLEQDNYVELRLINGRTDVRAIDIAARKNGTGDDFYLVGTVKKDSSTQENVTLNTFGNPGTITTSDVKTMIPDSLANWAHIYFIFTGEEVKIPIDIKESNRLYDDVPQLAKSQEIIDGNRLVYGNIVNGYDPIPTDTELSVVYKATESTVGTQTNFGYSVHVSTHTCNWNVGWSGRSLAKYTMKIQVPDMASRVPGEVIHIKMNGICFANAIWRQLGLCGDEFGSRIVRIDFDSTPFVVPITGATLSDLRSHMENNCLTTFTDVHNAYTSSNSKINLGRGHGHTSHCQADNGISTGTVYQGGSAGAGLWGSSGSNITLSFNAHGDDPMNTGACNYDFYAVFGPSGYEMLHGSTTPDFNTNIPGEPVAGGYIDGDGDHSGTHSNWKWRERYLYDMPGPYISDYFDIERNFILLSVPEVSSGNFRGFKSGTRHNFGLVYYDAANRSGTVNKAGSIYIPSRHERDPAITDYTAHIHFKINHLPPDWATHYQWVHSSRKIEKFVHLVVGEIMWEEEIKSRYNTVLPDSQRDEDNTGAIEPGYQAIIESSGGLTHGAVLMDMDELIKHSGTSSENDFLWDWKKGDRVKIIDTVKLTGNDWEIIGVVEDILGEYGISPVTDTAKLWFVLEHGSTGTVQSAGAKRDVWVEIYRPTPEGEDTYHEFNHTNKLGWDSVGNTRIHRANTWACGHNEGQLAAMGYEDSSGNPMYYVDETGANTPVVFSYDQYDAANPDTNLPAEGTFLRGDIYLRERIVMCVSPPYIIMSENYTASDFFKSKAWDLGRPNAYLPDFKQTRRNSTIFFSEPYIPNTAINGLGTFYPDVSFQEYDKSYNSIQKLFSINDSLIILQEDKISRAMVSRAVLFDATAEQNVAISQNVLSSSIPYVGDFGISRNPESFANFGFRSYFVDIRRRVVLRLSQDGLTPISEARMKNFFTDYFQEVIDNKKHIGSTFRAYGAYDNKFDEYVVSIPTINWVGPVDPTGGETGPKPKINGFTVGFHEPSKRWNSFYGYENHIMTYNTELHSFQAGMAYRHNSSDVEYNTFYGIPHASRLYFPSNMSPDATKVYNTIAEESTDIWEVFINTRNGQSTTITTQEFTNGQTFVWEEGHGTKENIHHAFIRGDVNSTGGKIEGDRIRDTSIMAGLTLPVGPAQEENTLFSVKFGLTASGSPDLLGNVT